MEPPLKKRRIEKENPLNPSYIASNSALISSLKTSYQSGDPFPHLILKDFFTPEFLKDVLIEMLQEEWVEKKNDLYEFMQTKSDLKSSGFEKIKELKNVIYSQRFREFMQEITGIELNWNVDMFGSQYKQGNTLLCHDDELEGRRIAFILYMVGEDWCQEDGGCLELFNVDEHLQPVEIGKSIVPEFNNFLFFEVSPVSYHQVAEVFSENKTRFAISGWFHGKDIERPMPYVEPVPVTIPRSKAETGFDITDWIHDEYLSEKTQSLLKEHFENESCLGLNEFLKEEKLKDLEESLSLENWERIGPYNRRNYYSLGRTEENLTEGIVKDFKLFLRSEAFFQFLEKITGVNITGNLPGEYRTFVSQSYTLVHDNQHQHNQSALDLQFTMIAEEWFESYGGYTTYLDEESELLCVMPTSNTLSVVFRDTGCMRFVKYLPKTKPTAMMDLHNSLDIEFDETDSE